MVESNETLCNEMDLVKPKGTRPIQVHLQLTQFPGLGTELLVHDVLIDVEKKKRDHSI